MAMYQQVNTYADARLVDVDAEGFVLAAIGPGPAFRKVDWDGKEGAVSNAGSDTVGRIQQSGEQRIEQFEHLSLAISEGRIVASDRKTGKRLWTHEIRDSGWYADATRLYKGSVSERLFFFQEQLFFTSGPHVFALDWTDGRELWHIRMPLNEALITVDPEGMLFIKSGYYIYLVDMADGAQLPLLDLEAAQTPLTQWLSHGAIQGREWAVVDTERSILAILDKHDLTIRQELPLADSQGIGTDVAPVFFGSNLFLDDRQGVVYWFVNR